MESRLFLSFDFCRWIPITHLPLHALIKLLPHVRTRSYLFIKFFRYSSLPRYLLVSGAAHNQNCVRDPFVRSPISILPCEISTVMHNNDDAEERGKNLP